MGVTNNVNITPKDKPKITVLAKGDHISAPAPNSNDNGIIEHIVVIAVNNIGRILRLHASKILFINFEFSDIKLHSPCS